MMKIEQEDPTAIEIPHRLRAVNPAKVKQLAESMKAIGLQQPVTVWMPVDGQLELVAGAHRVQAACDLGWDWIDCIFADGMTDIDRQLWEIDENLMRAELSPTEMAEHLAKRTELWEARQSAQVAPIESKRADGRGHRSEGFASETAAATGINKSTVNRALSRANAIPGDIRAIIKYTKLDTGTYLDSLKGMEPDDQREKVKRDLAERSVQLDAQIRAANRANAELGKQIIAVKLAWRRASAEDKRRIKAWILEQETPADDGGGDD